MTIFYFSAIAIYVTYNIQSTVKISDISSGGNPTVSNTITNVTKPACGIPAAPMLAAVDVMLKTAIMTINTNQIIYDSILYRYYYLTATTFPKDNGMPRSCAIKIEETASYNAVPSILIVAPIGIMNLATFELTLFFSSKHCMLTGSDAEDEAVPNAVAIA